MKQNLTHLSLFSGIGGIDLAAEWAGFETVGQCEFADYLYQVLCKRWKNVPKWRDIRDVTAESFKERTGITNLALLSGGFPCQPHSLAGKRKASADERCGCAGIHQSFPNEVTELPNRSLEWLIANRNDFFKTVFLTREEAEKALKERESND